MHCLVLCAALGLRERTQEGLTARGESAAAEEGSKDMLCFFQCWRWPLKFCWCHKGFIQDHLLFNLSHLESWAGWRQKDSTASTGPFLCSKHELATIWMGSQRVVVSLFWSFKIYIKFCSFFWESEHQKMVRHDLPALCIICFIAFLDVPGEKNGW